MTRGEKSYDTSDNGSYGDTPRVYERYNGWKGIYYHPVTQVGLSSVKTLRYVTILAGNYARIRVLYVSRYAIVPTYYWT